MTPETEDDLPPRQVVVSQDNELPQLILNITRHIGEMEIGRVHLESRGHDIDQAANGMRFLIEEIKGLQRDLFSEVKKDNDNSG